MGDAREGPDSGFWQFYCWLCGQWCEREGPWCGLFREGPYTSPCYFVEYPERAAGVRFPYDMPPHQEPPPA